MIKANGARTWRRAWSHPCSSHPGGPHAVLVPSRSRSLRWLLPACWDRPLSSRANDDALCSSQRASGPAAGRTRLLIAHHPGRPERSPGRPPHLGSPVADRLPRADVVPDAQLLDGHRSLRPPDGHDQLQEEHRAPGSRLDAPAYPAAVAIEPEVVTTGAPEGAAQARAPVR